MKHLFISYNLAAAAKEKGFNESCLGFYNTDGFFFTEMKITIDDKIPTTNSELLHEDSFITAPLYQQIIDWFREKHNLAILLSIPFDVYWRYSIDGVNGRGTYTDSTYKEQKDFASYYDALNKAIEEAFKLI